MMALESRCGFENLDDDKIFDAHKKALSNTQTYNIAVKFDSTNAYSAVDLDAASLETFLSLDRPQSPVVRWIHIFGPERQERSIAKIARKYDLSPRLQKILVSPNLLDRKQKRNTSRPSRQSWASPVSAKHRVENAFTGIENIPDPEKGGPQKQPEENYGEEKMNHYNIVDDVWHFWSTDWSSRCVCVGYNSISNLKRDVLDESSIDKKSHGKRIKNIILGDMDELDQESRNKPQATRLWTWLLVCDDNTVISISENPLPTIQNLPNEDQETIVRQSRRTLCNVFKHLSKVSQPGDDTAIDTLDIRPGCSAYGTSTVALTDSPGLLFYYLFDDWYTTFDLVADKGYRYTTKLQRLRGSMFKKAQLSQIEQLHQTGRQLALLKRMYETYILIIDRILSRQKSPSTITAAASNTQLDASVHGQTQSGSSSPSQLSEEGGQAFWVPLTAKAAVRFERLKDRIKMYALSEIEECLEEKESLVFMNFNLMTMRQSQAVEKLTRVTILLAKVTIMFMPVSVLTGYYSTQIDELAHKYSAKTYWVSFAITILLSFLFLLGFGVFSRTTEGGPVYKVVAKLPRQAVKAMRNGRQGRGIFA